MIFQLCVSFDSALLQRLRLSTYTRFAGLKKSASPGDLFDFLGVERIALKDLSPQNRPMPSSVIQMIRMIGAIPGIDAVPAEWRESVKRRIGRLFAVGKPRMSEETRRFLVEYFKPHNAGLSELAGRKLDQKGLGHRRPRHEAIG